MRLFSGYSMPSQRISVPVPHRRRSPPDRARRWALLSEAKPLACFTSGNPLGGWPPGLEAFPDGFITTPTVVRDACGDHHSAPHDANLLDMNAKYADVVSEAEILDSIEEL
jgi:hypothetical protein